MKSGGKDNHPALWLRFVGALGVARDAVLTSEPLLATYALIDTFLDLTQHQPVAAGLAALYVYESQTSAVAEAKIDGLRRFYGITNKDGLRFFTVHQEADPYHARTVARMVEHHAQRLEDHRAALRAGRAALAALWSMLDAV
jgi:pyrroloquinoline-quinone synthase